MKPSADRIKMREYLIATLIKVEILCSLTGIIIPAILQVDIHTTIRFFIGMLILGAVLGTIAGFQNFKEFIKPINELSEYTTNLYNDDLAYRIDLTKTSHQKTMFEWLNAATENMSSLIKDVISLFKLIINNAAILKSNSDQVTSSSDQIAAGIEQVTASISQHVADISVITEKMKDISDEIIKLKDIVNDMLQKSDKASALSINGHDMIEEVKDKIKESNLARIQANYAIKTLDNKAKEITLITNTIIGISAQTNLLALNAAIEAARAGEHGKGFGVVSEEIRQLAEQSSSSVKKIIILVNEIQSQIQQTIGKISDMGSVVDQQNKVVGETNEIFLNITGSIEDISNKINSIDNFSKEINESKNELTALVTSLLKGSEDIAATAQEIAACTEEQTASMHQINNVVLTFNQAVEELSGILDKFRV